jgi:hypothetical protein
MEQFLKDWNWVLTTIVGIILSIVIYLLQKRISFKSKRDHRNEIINKLDNLLKEIYHEKSRNAKAALVDISKIKSFPKEGYFKTEIIGLNFSGLICYCGAKVYKNKKGHLTYKEKGNEFLPNLICFGIIPYENIEDVDLAFFGDEYESCAKVYCNYASIRFNNGILREINNNFRSVKERRRFWKRNLIPFRILIRSPFVEFRYFKLNDDYKEGKYHYSLKYVELASFDK